MRNNQNCQKIKLYGNQGVQEETFIQTSRRDRNGQTGWRGCQQGSGWLSEQSHICVRINQEEQLGSETD